MAKEMNNYVIVEGILSEIGLERAVWNNQDVIRGDITVKVVAPITKGAAPTESQIPVRFFVKKLTNAGNENPAYTSVAKILDSGKSIAAVGEEEADCVSIRGARLQMNEYYAPDGHFVTFPVVNGSFINVIRRIDMKPQAKADVTMVVDQMRHLTDRDGIETGKFMLTGVTIGYGGWADVIPFVTENPQYISAIEATYKHGDIISVSARLNFSSTTETIYEEVEIGEPIERSRTQRVSDIVIAAVKSADAIAESYTVDDIREAVNKRNARNEEKKIKAEHRNTTERTKADEQARTNLGF